MAIHEKSKLKHDFRILLKFYQVCPNAALISDEEEDSDSSDEEGEGEEEKVKSWQERLTSFERLIFIKAFKEEKVRESYDEKRHFK